MAEIETVTPAAIAAHAIGLANVFRQRLDLAPESSPIVLLPDQAGSQELAEEGFSAATLAIGLRLSMRWYTSGEDVERAAEIVKNARRLP